MKIQISNQLEELFVFKDQYYSLSDQLKQEEWHSRAFNLVKHHKNEIYEVLLEKFKAAINQLHYARLNTITLFIQGEGTDSTGHFELNFAEKPSKLVELIFSFIGFIPLEKSAVFTDPTEVNLGKVILQEDTAMFAGEVVVTSYNPVTKLRWKIGRLFTKSY